MACTLAVIASLAAPARADDAQALLLKHLAFAGWSFGDGTYKTLSTQWSVTRTKDGTAYKHVAENQMGITRRSDTVYDSSGEHSYIGFTGTFAWQSSDNGFTTKVVGDAAKFQISRSLIFDEGATVSTGAVLEPPQSIDGKTFSVVRVKIDASLPVDLYIDPDSGAYRRAVIDPGGASEATFDILETTEPVAGKKIVSRYTTSGYTHKLDKAVANHPIAASALAPPPATAQWSFGSGEAIPVRVTAQRIYITAKVNGVEGHFILDTGAAGVFLSSAFAKRAKLETGETYQGIGIGGTFRVTARFAKSITIGDNTLSNVIVSSADFENDGEQDGQDGLMGYDLLGAALVVLNLDDSDITFLDPTKMQPDTSAGVPVLVDLTDQTPRVPMKLNRKFDVRATLDSGNPLYVTFDRALVAKHGLKFLLDRSNLASSGLAVGAGGGYVDVECGKLENLTLGPISYEGPPACMGQAVVGNTSDRDVLVGLDFLKHFNIVFDYPAALILFQQRKTEPR